MWGALGYAIAVLSVGWLLDQIGLSLLFVVHAGILLLTLLIAVNLPIKQGRGIEFKWKEAMVVFKSAPYVSFLLFNFLLQLTVSAHNSFYSLYLKQFGIGLTMVGFALLLKSILEIPFFATSNWFLKRFSFRFLLALVAVVYAARWLILGVSTSPFLLIASQVLLSLSFSVHSFTAVVFVDQVMPDKYKSTGQTLYWATSFGLSGVAGNVLAAWFLNHFSIGAMYQWITGIVLIAALIIWVSIRNLESNVNNKQSVRF